MERRGGVDGMSRYRVDLSISGELVAYLGGVDGWRLQAAKRGLQELPCPFHHGKDWDVSTKTSTLEGVAVGKGISELSESPGQEISPGRADTHTGDRANCLQSVYNDSQSTTPLLSKSRNTNSSANIAPSNDPTII